MDATAVVHPTVPTLRSYGTGTLDDASSRSVRKHLESCSNCRRRVAELSSDSFLDGLPGAGARPDFPGPVVSADNGLSALQTGSSLETPPSTEALPPGLAGHPDYEIVRELGQGGMGTVYLALNRLMGRHEVLKVVNSHLLKRKGALERFLGEIRCAGRLQHTHIVTSYAASRLGPTIMFAMEYVDGLDLAKLVQSTGPLPVANACSYAYQAALGLQHAHELGMVHRDIKPSNLMLSRQGSRAIVKVLDFGLAKVKSEGDVEGGLTHAGQMLGTPDYIAPEQIGDARAADIRADIYSLGCTLYYLLTGGPPFKATSLYEILQAHHSMDATPLNLARPDVPVELAALVAKMMAKEPAQRFQSPDEVAQALKPFFKSGGAWNGGPKVELSFPGLDGPVREAREKAPTAVPHLATNNTDRPLAVKPAPEPTRAGSEWERLIDLRETEPLSDASPVAAGMTHASPRASWPIIVAVAVIGAAVLGGGFLYLITREDRIGLIVRANDNKTPPVENKRSPVAASTAENAGPATTGSSGTDTPSEDASGRSSLVVSENETSHSHKADFGTAGTKPEEKSGPVAGPLTNADASRERLPLPAKESPAPAPAAPSVGRDTVVSPEQQLQKLGLKWDGKVYVLAQESDVQQKFNMARSLIKEHKIDVDKRMAIERAIATFQQLDKDVIAYDFQINELNRQLGQRPGRPNSDQIAFFDNIKAERDRLAGERNEAIFNSRRLKSEIPSPRERNELDAKIERGRESCRSTIGDLGRTIESTNAQYADLKKNDQIQAALTKLGGRKLGPSSAYNTIVKQAPQQERYFKALLRTAQPSNEPSPKKKSPGMRKR